MSDVNQTFSSESKLTNVAGFATAHSIGRIALVFIIIGVFAVNLGVVDESISRPLIEIKYKGPKAEDAPATMADARPEAVLAEPAGQGEPVHAQDAADQTQHDAQPPAPPSTTEVQKATLHAPKPVQTPGAKQTAPTTHDAAPTHATPAPETTPPAQPPKAADHAPTPIQEEHTPKAPAPKAAEHAAEEHKPVSDKPAEEHAVAHDEHATAEHDDHGHDLQLSTESPFPVKGMAFVNAAIQPIRYELTERFWGWRPNDIVNLTDNVTNFQLGVLEVTRRTAVALAERLSRTGSTAAFDPTLQNAMNWFMIKADRYWFPSAESKYKDGIKELGQYLDKLEKGEATFFTRTDNLIPLLAAYEDLLGSCDENLVKFLEEDGSPVSFFKADDYFYYAQGISSAMMTIMQAVLQDFHTTVDGRRGTEVLVHAIESLHHATVIDPLLILNSDLNGILANHRANMAAPISHARFYIGLLIKTLST
jgi:hypothetical protein